MRQCDSSSRHMQRSSSSEHEPLRDLRQQSSGPCAPSSEIQPGDGLQARHGLATSELVHHPSGSAAHHRTQLISLSSLSSSASDETHDSDEERARQPGTGEGDGRGRPLTPHGGPLELLLRLSLWQCHCACTITDIDADDRYRRICTLIDGAARISARGSISEFDHIY